MGAVLLVEVVDVVDVDVAGWVVLGTEMVGLDCVSMLPGLDVPGVPTTELVDLPSSAQFAPTTDDAATTIAAIRARAEPARR